jgi:hypothetical protein
MYIAVYEGSSRWGKNKNEHLSQKKILNLFGIDKLAPTDINNMVGNLLKSLNVELKESKEGLVLSIGASPKK